MSCITKHIVLFTKLFDENTFLYFINEQRKTVWTESTAMGHITTPHSQSHSCPDNWKISIVS